MQKRQQALRRGYWAEVLCKFLLRFRGYKILHHRWKKKGGEIDIIALEKQTVVIIEIKYRRTRESAAMAFTPLQQHRLIHLAKIFQTWYPEYNGYDIRFDMILVLPWRLPYHLKNAWHL